MAQGQTETISLIAAGDLCMTAPWNIPLGAQAEQDLFSDLRPLLDGADIRLVNLENPLLDNGMPIPKSGPNLKGPESGVSLLLAVQADLAILANNHIGDFGSEGVMRTLEILQRAGVAAVGAGANEDEAARPWITERKGRRIAVLAVAENEFGTATASAPGSNGYEARRMAISIAATRNLADDVVVVMHGGNELNPVPSPLVVDRYRTFVDAGADAVIGMHPHCPQGFEVYDGKPIFYSCGNFLFGYPGHGSPLESWYYGYLPRIEFGGPQPDFTVHPYCFSSDGRHITLLAGSQLERFMAYLSRISAVIADPIELQKHYEGWCILEGGKRLHGLMHSGRPVETGHPGAVTDLDTLILRNILTCEAHNDLAKTYIRIVCDGRYETCRHYVPMVKNRQQIT